MMTLNAYCGMGGQGNEFDEATLYGFDFTVKVCIKGGLFTKKETEYFRRI